ncbi:hypothetical protein AB4Z46_21030 [Variovorax sp. M-6]|uniref:hypothetical protein n=1 Tax=Variovorax sp. M-6 TaxID=3233041 RepID=UPI003F987B09
MAVDSRSLTPQQRLAMSRRALVAQFQGSLPEEKEDLYALAPRPATSPGASEDLSWAPVARHVVRRWWRRHPVNAAGQIARPLLERYAREQPARLMGAAAAAGALVVLVKPWRLLSVTALVAAVLKTSDVADLVTTLMQRDTPPRNDLR